jgi:hypothetical protein
MNRIEGCFHAGMKCQRKVLAKWQRQSKKEAGLRGRIPKFQQVGFVPSTPMGQKVGLWN